MNSQWKRSPVTVVVVVLVAATALQLAFIGSYVGAFHDPTPHRVPVDLVAPPRIAAAIAARLDALPGTPVEMHIASSTSAAHDDVLARRSYGYLEPGSRRDTLAIATAANKATAVALTSVFSEVAAGQNRPPPRIVDLAPLPSSDASGTSGFYAVIGWMIGGYLGATLLGLVRDPRARSRRRAVIRVAAITIYSVIAGLLGVVLLNGVIGVLGGHFLALWGIAALAIFAATVGTAALQSIFGVAGTGVAILLFVILGNPSSGGAYARDLVPGFWRSFGALLPPGAAVDLVRNTIYFDGNATVGPILVLLVWSVIGVLIAVALGGRHIDPEVAEAEAVGGVGAI